MPHPMKFVMCNWASARWPVSSLCRSRASCCFNPVHAASQLLSRCCSLSYILLCSQWRVVKILKAIFNFLAQASAVGVGHMGETVAV